MTIIADILDEGLVPFLIRKTMRTAITMKWVLLQPLSYLAFRPTVDEQRYIYKVNNEHWQGSIIMKDISKAKNDWTAIQKLKSADIIIFEIHGGGFRVGTSTMYMSTFIAWINLLKSKRNHTAAIFSVEYGLCPEFPYPIAKNQCLKAFRHLVYDIGISPSKIILSSDSAGGSLVLEMLIDMYAPRIFENSHTTLNAPRENFDIPLPAGAFFCSPLVTANTTSPSFQRRNKEDVVSMKLAKLIYEEYARVPEKNFPDQVPIFHLQDIKQDFDRFMPQQVLVFQGSKESFLDDVLRWVADMEADNGSTNVQLYLENYYHDWYLFPLLIKRKDRWIIDKYNQLFVDWAVDSLEKASISSTTL